MFKIILAIAAYSIALKRRFCRFFAIKATHGAFRKILNGIDQIINCSTSIEPEYPVPKANSITFGAKKNPPSVRGAVKANICANIV